MCQLNLSVCGVHKEVRGRGTVVGAVMALVEFGGMWVVAGEVNVSIFVLAVILIIKFIKSFVIF